MRATIEDLITLFESGPIFQPGIPLDTDEYAVTADLEAALRGYDEGIGQDSYGEEQPWTRIHNLKSEQLHTAMFGLGNHRPIADAHWADLERVGAVLVKRLRFTAYQAAIDGVDPDLYLITFAMHVPMPFDDFYGRLLAVYQKGGWPYGWEGDYPDGRFKVFVPDTPIDETNRLIALKRERGKLP